MTLKASECTQQEWIDLQAKYEKADAAANLWQQKYQETKDALHRLEAKAYANNAKQLAKDAQIARLKRAIILIAGGGEEEY